MLAQVPVDTEPEMEIVRDVLRRGLPLVPVPLIIGALIAGVDGVLSAATALAMVVANLLAVAISLVRAARINLGLLMGVALFGYLLRVSALFGLVFLLKDLGWIHLGVLGGTLIVTHLGLLAWELKYVSASLAHPDLKPVHKEPVT